MPRLPMKRVPYCIMFTPDVEKELEKLIAPCYEREGISQRARSSA